MAIAISIIFMIQLFIDFAIDIDIAIEGMNN